MAGFDPFRSSLVRHEPDTAVVGGPAGARVNDEVTKLKALLQECLDIFPFCTVSDTRHGTPAQKRALEDKIRAVVQVQTKII